MKTLSPDLSWIAVAALLGLAACSDNGPLAPSRTEPAPVGGDVPGSDDMAIPTKELDSWPASSPRDPGEPAVPRQAVVNVSEAAGVDLPTLNARWNTTTVRELEDGVYAVIETPAGYNVEYLCEQMTLSGDCDVAQPNWELEAPEVNHGIVAFVESGHVFSDVEDQGALTRIGAPTAQLQYQGNGTVVAVLDTGVDFTHPDLAGALLAGWDFVEGDADPSDVADGIDQDGDQIVDEGAGHGTHVAGIIHAVAPGAQILPVRVMDSEGVGNSADIARGIRWAVDNGADVINMSLGMRASADVMKDALDYADSLGVFVVASAGNEGIQVSDHFPANLSKVVAVAATDANDLKAPFSNFGSYVDLSAPGEGILSTYLGGQYAVWSGTSFSTPMVAGGAALWYEKYPGGNPADATNAVKDTASPLDTTGLPYDGKIGAGLLDCAALILWTPTAF